MSFGRDFRRVQSIRPMHLCGVFTIRGHLHHQGQYENPVRLTAPPCHPSSIPT